MTYEPIQLVLRLSGPPESVNSALQALRGTGFIHWGDAEANIFAATAAGHDEFNLPDELKEELRRTLMATLDLAWRRAFTNPLGIYDEARGVMSVDFRTLLPIPEDVVKAGWKSGGEDWVKQNWGCLPLRHMSSLEIVDETVVPAEGYYMVGGRLRKRRGIKPIPRRKAAIGMEVEFDWPWPLVRAIARRWQDLYVNLEQDTDNDAVDADGRLGSMARLSRTPKPQQDVNDFSAMPIAAGAILPRLGLSR